MGKIIDTIVYGSPNYEETIFDDTFQDGCTDEELKELYDTLYGWSTLTFYTAEYRKRLKQVMRNIDKKLKQRNNYGKKNKD